MLTTLTSSPPPVLLLRADRVATLAAVRSLGRRGVPVVAGASSIGAPGYYSRYTRRRVRTPSGPARLVPWLERFGRANSGHALIATDDTTAWLIARHRDQIAQHFRLASPPFTAMRTLLDKLELARACETKGIPAPATHLLTPGSVDALARCLPFPVYVKARLQVGARGQFKGELVREPAQLAAAAARATAALQQGHAAGPERTAPIVQPYLPSGSEGIFSLTGFAGEHGVLLGARGARKVLQRPLAGGLGICLEDMPVPPALAQRVVSLAAATGYHGPFEVEFAPADGEWLLLDFNTRIAKSVWFDVARGLDLPAMAYAAALGDGQLLTRLAGEANAPAPRVQACCDRPDFDVLLACATKTGELTPAQARRWRHWRRNSRHGLVSPVFLAADPLPGLARVIGKAPHWAAELATARWSRSQRQNSPTGVRQRAHATAPLCENSLSGARPIDVPHGRH